MKRLTTCPLCEASCGIEVEIRDGRPVSVRPDPGDVLSAGHMCTKAGALIDLHEDPDRLRQPMRRRGTAWEPVGWDDAFAEIGRRFGALRAKHGRNTVGVYLGNPIVHNHEALLGLVPLLASLRTRARFSATSADQLPQMFAALHMFGHHLLFPVPDLDRTQHLVILGANPAASNGSLMTAPGIVRRIKAIQKRGGKVVVIDPRRTETASHADSHHHIQPGTDAYLLLAMIHVVFDENLANPDRLVSFTTGIDTLRGIVESWPPERVANVTGIEPDMVRTLARDFATASSAALYARVGICTQRFGGLSAWLQFALNIVTGNLDRAGGMMLTKPAFDLVKLASLIGQGGSHDSWRSRVSGRPEFAGENSVAVLAEEIETPGEGQIRGLITMAGNPVLSAPNGPRIDEALSSLDFMVSIDPYINETTRHANFVLPPITHLQRPYCNLALGMLSVRHWAKYAEPVLPREPGALDDGQIMNRLARAVLKHEGGSLAERGRAVAMHAALTAAERIGIPRLLDLLLRVGPSKLTLGELEAAPHGIDLGPLIPVFPERLYTPDKTIELTPTILTRDLARLAQALDDVQPSPENGSFALIGRRHIRSNNSWLHNAPSMAGKARRCTLLMHPEDAEQSNLLDGSRVQLSSRVGTVEATLEVDDAIMRGVVSLPHGYGHGLEGVQLRVANATEGASINDVTDDEFLDELTGTVAFSGVPVQVRAL